MLSTSLLQSSVLYEKYENEPEVYKEEDCHLEKKYIYVYIYF